MKKLSIAALVLAGCAGARPEPALPADAERDRSAPAVASRPPAPDAPLESLTLARALELAERLHPDLARARARVEAAEGRALQAGLLPNPSLVGRLESAPFEGSTTGEAEYLAGLSQRLPLGGRLGAAREVERREAERLRRDQEIRSLEIRSQVQGAFATSLFAAEVAKLQGETLELSRRAVDVVKARRAGGDATADELARAEMAEAWARLEEDKAHGLRELAFVGLAAALGAPELKVGAVEGPLETALELPTLASILAALDGGPHAALARSDVEAAQARLELARIERVPDVTLELFYRRLAHSETDAFDVGVVVPLPLFDRQAGSIREAKAGKRDAEARARATRGEAVRRIREAHVKLSEALTHSRLVREEIVPRAGTVLRAAEARHAAGDLSLADLLPIRRDYAAMRLTYLEALREVMEAWGELRLFLRP